MDVAALKAAVATAVPPGLAEDLVDAFIEIRRDVATRTLGRASPGKFVESVVQALQAIERGGTYDAQPDVDKYLRGLESRAGSLPDGLRICASRIARGMYALRSKRNIVHKADVDPSTYDLRFLYAGAQWVLAELLALASGITSAEAGRLIEEVQLPVGELVEAIDGRQIAHGDLTVREEALVLLMQNHPMPIPVSALIWSMDRRSPNSVRKGVAALWKAKLLHRTSDGAIVLTERGLAEALSVAQQHVR
jgi:hypothetical protein